MWIGGRCWGRGPRGDGVPGHGGKMMWKRKGGGCWVGGWMGGDGIGWARFASLTTTLPLPSPAAVARVVDAKQASPSHPAPFFPEPVNCIMLSRTKFPTATLAPDIVSLEHKIPPASQKTPHGSSRLAFL